MKIEKRKMIEFLNSFKNNLSKSENLKPQTEFSSDYLIENLTDVNFPIQKLFKILLSFLLERPIKNEKKIFKKFFSILIENIKDESNLDLNSIIILSNKNNINYFEEEIYNTTLELDSKNENFLENDKTFEIKKNIVILNKENEILEEKKISKKFQENYFLENNTAKKINDKNQNNKNKIENLLNKDIIIKKNEDFQDSNYFNSFEKNLENFKSKDDNLEFKSKKYSLDIYEINYDNYGCLINKKNDDLNKKNENIFLIKGNDTFYNKKKNKSKKKLLGYKKQKSQIENTCLSGKKNINYNKKLKKNVSKKKFEKKKLKKKIHKKKKKLLLNLKNLKKKMSSQFEKDDKISTNRKSKLLSSIHEVTEKSNSEETQKELDILKKTNSNFFSVENLIYGPDPFEKKLKDYSDVKKEFDFNNNFNLKKNRLEYKNNSDVKKKFNFKNDFDLKNNDEEKNDLKKNNFEKKFSNLKKNFNFKRKFNFKMTPISRRTRNFSNNFILSKKKNKRNSLSMKKMKSKQIIEKINYFNFKRIKDKVIGKKTEKLSKKNLSISLKKKKNYSKNNYFIDFKNNTTTNKSLKSKNPSVSNFFTDFHKKIYNHKEINLKKKNLRNKNNLFNNKNKYSSNKSKSPLNIINKKYLEKNNLISDKKFYLKNFSNQIFKIVHKNNKKISKNIFLNFFQNFINELLDDQILAIDINKNKKNCFIIKKKVFEHKLIKFFLLFSYIWKF